MTESDEQLAGKSLSISHSTDERDPFSEGLYTIGLTQEQVGEYGSFLDDFYQRIRDSRKRQVTRTASSMLQGAFFAIGTRELQNPEWQEHCATSLREIFHEWNDGGMESEFNEFYRNNSNKLKQAEKEVFKEFRLHYKYFTGIDHHEASTVLGALSAILKNNSIKLKDCYKEDVFLDRVKNFFHILSQIIELSKQRT